MKVAFISQPWDPMRPPVTAGSVAIWVYEVSRRLAKTCDVTVYAQQSAGDAATEHYAGIEFRRFPLGRTGRSARIMHQLFGRPSRQRPFFASPWFCRDYITAIAKEIRRRRFDIVHIQNYSQYVSIVRKYNPNVRIVLHMRCEWLLQLDRRMLMPRIGQADLLISVGNYLTNATIQRFPSVSTKIMTLANGVDTTFFDSLAEGIDIEHYRPSPSLQAMASRVLGWNAPSQPVPLQPAAVELHHAVQAAGAMQSADEMPNVHSTTQPGQAELSSHLMQREALAAIRAELGLQAQVNPESPLLLFVSRISPEKGVHILIEAFARVHREFPGARLRLIGPPGALEPELMLELSDDPVIQGCAEYFRGDYLSMLKRMVPADAAPNVEWVGHVPHDRLPDHYREAAILVAPSLSEAFGRAPIEAMSCGTPVVGARTGGIAESVVDGETGLLVPANNAVALADAILTLLRDPDLRVIMGAKAWQRVHQNYSWESIAAQTRAYYEELLGSQVRATEEARDREVAQSVDSSIP